MNIDKKWTRIISYLIIIVFIIIIIPLHLFPCFIAGFLAYEVIIFLTPLFEHFVGSDRARWTVIAFIAIIVVLVMTFSIVNLVSFLTSDIQQSINIAAETNRILSNAKNCIPKFLTSFLPENTEELKDQFFALLESNLIIIRNMSHTFLHGLITLIIGFIIGAVISLNKSCNRKTYLVEQLLKRIHFLSDAFRNIVFAQIKISLINTLFTAAMVLIFLPILKINLPLGKTLIVATFILGLLPIIGNLISNFMIIISALSISLLIGGVMIIYLILIHKLEYFLNAKIIGNRIKAKSWELLLIMLLLESIFGLEGLIAAPIYYAYIKSELRELNLI